MFELTQNLLLYSPACHKTDFIHAIGYLIRRLDENTGPDNFLSHAFNVRVDSDDWRRLEQQFLDCFSVIETISDKPRRTQDRNEPPQLPTTGEQGPTAWQHFVNEPDTDFSLPHNTSWAEELVETWQSKCGENATDIPLFIAGEDVSAGRATRECLDPSRPGVVVGRYRQATIEDVAKIVDCAKDDEDGWRTMSHSQLAAIMRQAAHEIRVARGDLMGAAMADGGKTVLESDPEVSEAVDFVEFYTQTAEYFHHCDGAQARGKGVVVVVSPWNFPIAIPCGGVAAALAAGNTVILKPASDTVLVAHLLCECFWRAGVSKKCFSSSPARERPSANHWSVTTTSTLSS